MRRARCPPRWPIQTGSPDFCASADYLNGALVVYRGTGHFILAPYAPALTAGGGDVADQAAADADAWRRTLASLGARLGQPASVR